MLIDVELVDVYVGGCVGDSGDDVAVAIMRKNSWTIKLVDLSGFS